MIVIRVAPKTSVRCAWASFVTFDARLLKPIRCVIIQVRINHDVLARGKDGTLASDSFGTFLQTYRALEKKEDSGTRTEPIALLSVLASLGEERAPIGKLLDASGMSFTSFASALERLRDAGLVEMSGAPGREEVELTSAGEQIAVGKVSGLRRKS